METHLYNDNGYSNRMQTMARPRQQEARRRSLLDAAQLAAARHGVARLRLKDVADAAGISPAAVLYYYEGVEALLTELYRMNIARFCERRREAISAHQAPREQLVASIRHGVPAGPDDAEASVLWQLDAFAGSDPLYDVLCTQQFEEQVSVYERILAVGQDRGDFALMSAPRAVGQALVALEDALGRQVIGGNPQLSRADALRIIGSFASLAAGCEIHAED